VHLGPYDDSEIELTVKSKSIGSTQGLGFVVKESSSSNNIEYWPELTISSENRRERIYESSKMALENAERLKIGSVGFFTLGLEVSRVPSWEVAEEIAKAIYTHSKRASKVQEVIVVSSSPTQVSSFQYAFENIDIITP
jgi:O-acetyl-ADP-ribose deacetylase (regulator of RNase III)